MARVSLSLVRILRPILALGMLALLILNLKHADFLHSLAATKLVFIVGAIGAVILDGLARAWNWTQLIRAMHPGKPARFGVVLSIYWSGSFMGHFLPSTAGTDALRAMLAARRVGGPVSAHAAGVVMLNLISLLTGCAVGLVCVVWMAVATRGEGVRWVSIGLFSAPIAVGIVGYWLLRDQRGFVLKLLRLMRGRLRKVRRGLRRFMDRLLVFERLDVRAGPVFGIAMVTLMTRASVYALVNWRPKEASRELKWAISRLWFSWLPMTMSPPPFSTYCRRLRMSTASMWRGGGFVPAALSLGFAMTITETSCNSARSSGRSDTRTSKVRASWPSTSLKVPSAS